MSGMVQLGRPALGSIRSDRPLLLGDAYLAALAMLLFGYAVIGKSFAYLGLGGVYVGEAMLAAGLVVGLVTRGFLRVPRTRTVAVLVLFMAWCGARATFDVSLHGWATLRDSVIWAYGLFALIVAGLIATRPRRLAAMLRRYRRFITAFLMLTPLVWLSYVLFRDVMPHLPGSEILLLQPKPTDMLVHLSGIAVVLVLAARRPSVTDVLLLAVCIGLTAARTRGGVIAFAVAIVAVALAQPLNRRLWLGALGVTMAALLLLQASPRLSLAERNFSPEQLVTNALSVFSDSGNTHLDGPKAWRLRWWSKVVDYTFSGPYFWSGKGFGVNLATSDGFDLDADRTLRSPHNAHLSVLARAGVPGFLLWLGVLASWFAEMIACLNASRRRRQSNWSRLFLFLVAYALAFLVNATFDVFLEGPMGGIWFWCVFGFGLAAARLHRHWPRDCDGPTFEGGNT